MQASLLRKLYRQENKERDRSDSWRMLCVVGFLVCATIVTNLLGMPRVVSGALGGVSGMLLGTLILRGRSLAFTPPTRLRPLLVRMELCPACGYSIKGLPVQSDGCVVCAECGAAWRPHSPVYSFRGT